jgi:ATP/maltotriose-dependent transcriptional regulator MalT
MLGHPAEELVGRAVELAEVDAALAAVEEGGSAALAVVGEPGIGKTSVLAALAFRADARGHLVLSGAASELERDLPFWVFSDALDDYLRAVEPGRLDELGPDVLEELGHVLPALGGGAGADLQDHRFRTHRAMRRLLETLADGQPLVLVLDDVHWADSGSIELLGALLRRPPAAPVLLALASRPRQLPVRLAAALDRAQRAATLTLVEPGALNVAEAREMLGPKVTAVAAEALHEASGGNPFYLRQLARSGAGAAAAGDGGARDEAGVPERVRSALADELAGLDRATRRVLEGAAVAGDPFEPDLAARAAGVEEGDAMDALDVLLARDLVRPTEVPRRFRFRHPLVRRAVYEGAPGGWRLGAHERSADALAERGAPAAARAHHVEHAAHHGDAAAIAVLREAADAVAQRTPAGAARWYGSALRLLPADAPAAERVGLLGARAGALAATGQFEEAHDVLVDALAVAPPPAIVPLTVAAASVDQLLGRHEAARARLRDALDAVAEPVSGDAVTLALALGSNAAFLQDYPAGRDWALGAYDAARRLGEPAMTAQAAAHLALMSAFNGEVDAARRHHDEAAELIDALPDAELVPYLAGMVQLFSAELYLDRYADGVRHAERALALARATAQRQLFPSLVPLLGALLIMQGRFAEAAEQQDGVIEATRLAGNQQALAWALFLRAYGATMTGDLELALAAGSEAVELTRDGGGNVVQAFAGVILGVTVSERGDPADGAQLIMASGGGPALAGLPGPWRAYYLDWLTEALLGAGRREEAAAAAGEALAFAEASGLGLATLAGRRASARVALADDPRAAAEHARAAAAAGDAIGAPVEAAIARTLAGTALIAAGEPAQAEAELVRAADDLEELGVPRRRDAAERELRRLGRRDLHRRTRAGKADAGGLDSLTERELQVARLIVDRRTNPQIAAELFLSQKTVETHVRHLFQKLGVSSRVEVARAVERADRVGALGGP